MIQDALSKLPYEAQEFVANLAAEANRAHHQQQISRTETLGAMQTLMRELGYDAFPPAVNAEIELVKASNSADAAVMWDMQRRMVDVVGAMKTQIAQLQQELTTVQESHKQKQQVPAAGAATDGRLGGQVDRAISEELQRRYRANDGRFSSAVTGPESGTYQIRSGGAERPLMPLVMPPPRGNPLMQSYAQRQMQEQQLQLQQLQQQQQQQQAAPATMQSGQRVGDQPPQQQQIQQPLVNASAGGGNAVSVAEEMMRKRTYDMTMALGTFSQNIAAADLRKSAPRETAATGGDSSFFTSRRVRGFELDHA
jgi:hypothetical protein